MRRINRKEALDILRENKCPENVIRHNETVSRQAKIIAEKIKSHGFPVDTAFVEIAALLHDIGRCRTHGIMHGIEGAKILEDYPEYARACERHLGGGINKAEAKELGMPEKDYIPETLEEKIVTYADKLIDDDRKVPIEDTIRKFKTRLGENHPTIERIRRLSAEIESLKNHGGVR